MYFFAREVSSLVFTWILLPALILLATASAASRNEIIQPQIPIISPSLPFHGQQPGKVQAADHEFVRSLVPKFYAFPFKRLTLTSDSSAHFSPWDIPRPRFAQKT